MRRLTNLAVGVALVFTACSVEDENAGYCPIAVKHIPLEISIDYKCNASDECGQYTAEIQFGRVAKNLGIDCFGGVYEYTFRSGTTEKKITSDLTWPIEFVKPDSDSHLRFSLIDSDKDEKAYDFDLMALAPKYRVVDDSLKIDVPERGSVRIYYKNGYINGANYNEGDASFYSGGQNVQTVKGAIDDNIMSFFSFRRDSIQNSYGDLISFSGNIYWR